MLNVYTVVSRWRLLKYGPHILSFVSKQLCFFHASPMTSLISLCILHYPQRSILPPVPSKYIFGPCCFLSNPPCSYVLNEPLFYLFI
uniref:Uncharacterized protein n=1 Tax=Pyxicephalus adspersus TaxID=30357 RepID=A0AAV3AIX4_PYXAD|nr:TPA: hypothetical protein GDO54_010791 [Pyxicephalus adspersus]